LTFVFVALMYVLSEAASYPSTLLEFSAHPDMPIVSLEDLDHLLDVVLCHSYDHRPGAVITLNFASAEASAEALSAWTTPPTFTLVTLHPTCNLPAHRGAWLCVLWGYVLFCHLNSSQNYRRSIRGAESTDHARCDIRPPARSGVLAPHLPYNR
jgi:hypothetical protein